MRTVSDTTRDRTRATLDRMPKNVRDELRALLHRTSHLLCCTGIELVDPKSQQHRWLRDQSPTLGGPGCECKPMIWNDCTV